MTGERDDERFAVLLDALHPYLDRVVIVGGWAHRLFRRHPLARTMPYRPLMTRDTDVAIPLGIRVDRDSLRDRLLARGFTEKFLGDDRPPVTHYQLGDDDAGFYVEFITPLPGGEFRREGTRDVTTSVGGITAQKLHYVDVLLIEPWSVMLGSPGALMKAIIANPLCYIAQKLLINSKRRLPERAKDVLYIHDTLELFGGSLHELRTLWDGSVRPTLGPAREAGIRRARRRMFSEMTDTIRQASLMATGRSLSANALLELCQVGLAQTLG